MVIHSVTAQEAYSHCDPEEFEFETTAELEDLTRCIGQERALESVDFGIGIRHHGFNLFVMGAEGAGRHSVVKSFIDKKAATEETPSDWCYVHNFSHPHQPLALEFAPGTAKVFQQEMHELVDMLRITIPNVFEGENYQAKQNSIHETLQQKIDKLYHEVEEKAKEEKIAVIKTEQGIMFTGRDAENKPLSPEDFRKLPANERKKFEKLIEKYQTKLQQAINQAGILKREAEERVRKLKQDTARLTVSHLINTLKAKYKEQDNILSYFEAVEEEIVEGVDNFLSRTDKEKNFILGMVSQTPSFQQYLVNILVSHEEEGAPVVYEDLPTFQNLHGRIEHKASMGVLSTHFSLIKNGSLHRANGGYIIIDAYRLLRQPFAYEGLKRTLRSQKIRIESVERLLGLVSTVSLDPEPIPLYTKVVLIGDPFIYYLLHAYDPEFQTLFKVQADFEHSISRTKDTHQLYGSLLGGLAKDKELLPLHRTAVARVIEYAAREAGDNEKLSLYLRDFLDLLQEADFLARKKNEPCIQVLDIEEALAAVERRGDRIKDTIYESIDKGIRQIATSGEQVGQVNGLSVLQLGKTSFGCPARITVLTRPGKGTVVDIEREVKLGGPLHSKGVLILGSFLGARFARSIPLSLRASLVFEQSYGGIDGDSASCAELCALLSALAAKPIKQSIAITGSISQQGEVQAIGGVNEKIEGFFDICQQLGAQGDEGVIIPAANRHHLMLKKEVVEAIDQGKFRVYAVETIDDAIEILTATTPGEPDSEGNYPEDSVYGLVEATLHRYASDIAKFSKREKEVDKEQSDS